MILVFQEDGVLYLAHDEAAVYRDCEGLDVESGVYRFYDDRGHALKAVFDAPVKRGRWWSLWSTSSGGYHLELDSNASAEPLWVSIQEVRALDPNDRFASLDELKTFLRERGAPVDRPGSAI